MILRETLPDDGARYRCGFGTVINNESWHCSNDAKEAFTELDAQSIPKAVVIHCRALCENHLQFFGL